MGVTEKWDTHAARVLDLSNALGVNKVFTRDRLLDMSTHYVFGFEGQYTTDWDVRVLREIGGIEDKTVRKTLLTTFSRMLGSAAEAQYSGTVNESILERIQLAYDALTAEVLTEDADLSARSQKALTEAVSPLASLWKES